MKQLIKTKQFKEGARIFKCLNCKHTIVIPKGKEIKCIYCGNVIKEGRGSYYVIN